MKAIRPEPPAASFLIIPQFSNAKTGKTRTVKSVVGSLKITYNQAKYFGLKSHTQLSPMMEKCALLISANESYQRAEEDLEELTGIEISHSTLQRLVNRQEFELPTSTQGVQ